MPKRNCGSRAEWKLQTGRPAEALSAHYRLDCDYGTAVITCWEKGGSEPVYVCEAHAKELGPSRDYGPEARILADASERPDKPSKPEDGSQTQEIAETKSKGSDAPETVPRPAKPKAVRKVADAPARSRVRDLTFGNSAKAMVDEAIWNLATGDHEIYRSALQKGKSAGEAAQAAGGQLAVIYQKISDYTLKLEAVLAEAKATISVGETIDKPLERATLEIISSDAMGDSEKDAAIQELGAAQEWVKHGLQGEMTPLQTNQLILTISERLNWGGSTDISEELKAVYRALHGNLKTALCTAAPEAQNLHDRLTNLLAAKFEIDRDLLATKELTQAIR